MSMDSVLLSKGVVDPYPLTIQSEQALREGLFLAQRSILDLSFVNKTGLYKTQNGIFT